MADAQNPIPSPQSGDSDDVELALETSQRLYKNGDHAEALKWLRRAANSAEEAGDDMRQLQLARAAADLTAVVNAGPQVLSSAPSIPPAKPSVAPSGAPSRLPQPPAKQPAPPPAPSARGSVAPAAVSTSSKPSGAATKVNSSPTSLTPQPPATSGSPPPLPSAKPRPSPPSTSTSTATAAPVRAASESQAPPPRVSDSQMPPESKASALSTKPKPSEQVTSNSVVAAKPLASSTPSVTPIRADKPGASNPPIGSIGSIGSIDAAVARGAMRVSVRVSARDENLLIVRPLAQGQRLPVGAREARLVFEQDAAVSLNQSHGE